MFNRIYNAYDYVKIAFFGALMITSGTRANEGTMVQPFANIQNVTGTFCSGISNSLNGVTFSNSFLIGHLDQIQYYQENYYVNPSAIILNTALEFDKIALETPNTLENIFADETFKVVVADELSGNQAGQFSNALNQLSVLNPKHNDRAISYYRHEFHHAEMGLFHRKTNKSSTTPYDNEQQKSEILNAIKQGDERVKDFGKLLKKDKSSMSDVEISEYENKIKLFSNYQPRCFGEPFYGDSEALKKDLSLNKKVKSATGKLTKDMIKTPHGNIILTAHADNKDTNEAKAAAFVKDMLERSMYVSMLYNRPYLSKDENEQTQIKENDAALFEAPRKLLQVFYPEVLAYHASFAEIKKAEAKNMQCSLSQGGKI